MTGEKDRVFHSQTSEKGILLRQAEGDEVGIDDEKGGRNGGKVYLRASKKKTLTKKGGG